MFFENFRIALGLKKEQLENICLHEDLVNTLLWQAPIFSEQDSGVTI